MTSPAGNHVLGQYRRLLRIYLKRCQRIHRELVQRARLSQGEVNYTGLSSWSKNDLRWRDKKLSQLRELEKKLPFPEMERQQRIKEITDEILQDINKRQDSQRGLSE